MVLCGGDTNWGEQPSLIMIEELCWDAVGKRGGLTNYERPNVITLDLESIPSVFFEKKQIVKIFVSMSSIHSET